MSAIKMYYNSGTESQSCYGGPSPGWNTTPVYRVNAYPDNQQTDSYYGRPSYHQPETDSSKRLAFLYDNTYNSTSPEPLRQLTPSSDVTSGVLPPHISQNNDAVMSNGRCHDNDADEIPPPLPTSLPPSCQQQEYQPMSRATPAPMFQHVANTLPTCVAQKTRSPGIQISSDNSDNQFSRLSVNDNPSPGGATRSRDVTGRARAMPVSFVRRQSAPGPCLPPNSNGTPKKQWAITPCGFTNSRGQNTVVNGNHASSCGRNGLYTPQPNTSRVTEGPKLLEPESARRYRSFGSQESILDSNKPPKGLVDNTSIRYTLREGDEIGDYEQTSIRYTGKANPSKIFRLLQTATGSDTETDVKLAQAALRQQTRRRRPTQEELNEETEQPNADDIVDISYVGCNIPSRTFRCLQEAIGVRDSQDVNDTSEQEQQSSRNVRVVHLRPSIKKHSSMDNILSYSDL